MAKNVTQSDLRRLLGKISIGAAVALLAGAGLAYWGYSFATSQVHGQLAQERITFPEKGSKALDPKEFPGLQQYAGQSVDNGDKAKAFADEFIWVHMMKASGGKTYAEVSAASQANPTDTKLAGLKSTLFQGDTLRTSLLTAYAFSVFGTVAQYSIIACLIGAALAVLIALQFFARAGRG